MYHADLIGGILARFAGIKSIVWGIRGPYDKSITSISTKITIKLCAALSKVIPHYIISNSRYAESVHKRVGYSQGKFVYIPNGYCVEAASSDEKNRDSLRHEFCLTTSDTLIGMVARFDPYKDHENLFKTLSELNNRGSKVICLLVGPGMVSSNEELMNLMVAYHIEDTVRLLGPRDDIPNIMSIVDFHVLSSVAESFPNVIAEAMSYGTPCITTDVGDAAVIVGDTGWIVPPSDPEALFNAISEALFELKNTPNWDLRKRKCQDRIKENFSLEKMINAFNKVWEDVFNGKGH